MSAEEFNDDILISLDDNIIEEVIPLVTVKEEILKDDAILRLNKDQINAAITNLVIDKHRNGTSLRNKVMAYSKMFFDYPLEVNVVIKNLKPVIFSDKLTYFATEDDHTQNKQYEYSHFMKSEKLSNFLSQFNSINRDTSKQSSIQSANKLYALYAPFSNRESNDVHTIQYQPQQDQDAIRHCIFDEFDCASDRTETIRLVGQVKRNDVTYYDGDTVNVIGFFNRVSDNTHFEEFDINEYIYQVKKLKEGEKVHVLFNRPVFDEVFKKLKQTLTGTITHVNKHNILVSLNDTVYEDSKTKYDTISFSLDDILANNVLLYSAKTHVEDCFSKRKLLSNNILFRLPNDTKYTFEDIQSFIMPNSVAELIVMHEQHFHAYKNIRELQHKLLSPFGVSINDLPSNIYYLLTYIFNKNKLPMRRRVHAVQPRSKIPYKNTTPLLDFNHHNTLFDYYKQQYPSQDSYIDDALNRFRYLKSNRDNGSYYVLSVLKLSLKRKYNKHVQSLAKYKKSLMKVDDELDKLDFSPSGSKDASNLCAPKYSKEYKKLDKLVADNGKSIYFDKKLDKTPYGVLQGLSAKSANETKMHVINELMGNKYGISKKDLDFEVDAVLAGKRRIRSGDMCVLHTTYSDVVYVRKNVDGYEMWVKQFTTPFKVCTDSPLVSFNDLVKVNTCVKQSFDDVCRTNKDAKVMHRYQLLRSIQASLKNVLDVLENYEQIEKVMQNDITSYEYLNTYAPETHQPMRTFEHHEHIDYEDYDGDLGNVDDADYQIDGNDLGNFVFVSGQQGNAQKKVDEIENQDTLNMLLSFIQVPLDPNEFIYILQNVNALYPRSSIDQTLQQLEMLYWKKYNVNILKPTKEQLQLLKDKLNQAKQKKENELISKYYFNVLRTMIAYIIIIIFIRYPDYTIQVIIPSCVKLLSYVGYPVSDKTEPQRSLVSYFACLLTKISVSDDIRFALFYEKDQPEIQTSIIEAIDTILSHNIELKVQLEILKPKIASYKHIHHKRDVENTEMQGFKPNFKFGSIEKTNARNKKVLSYMKAIQETVASSKIAKQSILNVPNLFNACCAEVLKKDTDFFDYFENSNNYKIAKNKLSDLPLQTYNDVNLHPSNKQKGVVDIFSNYKIQQTDDGVSAILANIKDDYLSETVQTQIAKFVKHTDDKALHETLVDCANNFDKMSWWDDKFYPLMHQKWDAFMEMLKISASDKINNDLNNYIKAVIVDVGSIIEDIKTTRNVLFNFTRMKLTSILGTIRNIKKMSKEINDEVALRTDPLYSIIVSVANNKNYQTILQQFNEPIIMTKAIEHLYFNTDNEEVIVKNISVLAYVFIHTMHTMLKKSQTLHEKLSIAENNIVMQDNMKITCTIVYFVLEKLAMALQNTLVEPSKLKKAVEELRERRKQELIASYKVDDEERQLQITLKNMGLDSWADILTGNDQDMNEPPTDLAITHYKDEYDMAKDEIYETFKGEHNDMYEDDEDDEDVMVSYESYDY
jgi:hypothetical protein